MTKVAILIDGGFLLKRLKPVRPDVDRTDPGNVDQAIGQLVWNHLKHIHKINGGESPTANLYRCFYYDAQPYSRKGQLAISRTPIDYARTPAAEFRLALFKLLRKRPSFAVRLGEVRRERAWVLNEQTQKELLGKSRTVDDLTDGDFTAGLRQKAVDMRFGLDVASITLKKQADTLVLVTGDSDFVPAAKLARREGVRIILDPLWQSVSADLYEHIDELRSGFYRPGGVNHTIAKVASGA